MAVLCFSFLVGTLALEAAASVQADALSLMQLSAKALQRHVQQDNKSKNANGFTYYLLDEKEVSSRGSYCMDGSIPGYHYRAGTSDDKWTISFNTGKMWCHNAVTCADMLEGVGGLIGYSLFDSGDFKDYHHVQIPHCDAGGLMGDVEDRVTLENKQYYFRGKRILDHIMEFLKGSTTLGSATDVLVHGGSGGGHATVVLADRIKEMLPNAKKFGAVPMSGWYDVGENNEDSFNLHNMRGGISPRCRDALPSNEQYKCLTANVAYEHSDVPTFVVQMLDSVSLSGMYDATDEHTSAFKDCIGEGDGVVRSPCTSDEIGLLQEYLDNFVDSVKKTSKYKKSGNGGFLSTCKKHWFFNKDEYSHYANNGVTVEGAISDWWGKMNTAAAKWYLPCKLNANQPENFQCEESCSYDSASTD